MEAYQFDIDNQLIKIQNFKSQIDSNTAAIGNINTHTEEAIVDIRSSLEKEKLKNLKDF